MLTEYLESNCEKVSKHISKHDQKGFEMGIHIFEMKKDDLDTRPIPSYISVADHEFLVKYPGQVETCHVCSKPGHKAVDCQEKSEWPKLSPGSIKKRITTNLIFEVNTDISLREETACEKAISLTTNEHFKDKPTMSWFDMTEQENKNKK